MKAGVLKSFFLCVLCFVITNPATSQAQREEKIFLGNRLLLVLKSGIGKVYGSVILAVVNHSTDSDAEDLPLRFNFPLPLEMSDFQPQEGLKKEQIHLADGGGLSVDATFPKGSTLVSVGFFANVVGKDFRLTIPFVSHFEEFMILVQDEYLQISGDALRSLNDEAQFQQTQNIHASQGKAFVFERPIQPGTSVILDIRGIPTGRESLYVVGTVFGICLLLAGVILARRSMGEFAEASN